MQNLKRTIKKRVYVIGEVIDFVVPASRYSNEKFKTLSFKITTVNGTQLTGVYL